MKKFILEITIFVCGAMVMIMELTASRIMAPYFGTSNMIWTSIIGIILLSSSLGAYIGGNLSDKKPDYKVLSIIILIASAWILILPLINQIVLIAVTSFLKNTGVSAVISAILLFLVPSLLLGTVSPFAIKLKMKDLDAVGKTAGKLSAISTLGSIVGTFLAGFVLIPLLGSNKILYLIGVILIIISFLIYFPSIKKVISITLIGSFIMVWGGMYTDSLAKDKVLDVDSQYGRIVVYDAKISDREIRFLNIDKGLESAMFLDDPYSLAFEYTMYYDLMNYFSDNIKDTLLIGGAAYSYPKYYLDKYPERNIDVVEIDPKVTEIAKKYFYLQESDRLNIYHQDGRVYLNETEKKYDTILNDAFKGITPPFQLATKEAVKKIYDCLNPNGVYITNIISSFVGNDSKMLLGEVKTLKEVFPNVYIFACDDVTSAEAIQNIIVVASKDYIRKDIKNEADELLNQMLESRIEIEEIDNTIIFTDDYAPVEYYINSI